MGWLQTFVDICREQLWKQREKKERSRLVTLGLPFSLSNVLKRDKNTAVPPTNLTKLQRSQPKCINVCIVYYMDMDGCVVCVGTIWGGVSRAWSLKLLSKFIIIQDQHTTAAWWHLPELIGPDSSYNYSILSQLIVTHNYGCVTAGWLRARTPLCKIHSAALTCLVYIVS